MLIDDYKHKGLRKKLVKELSIKGITDLNVLNAIQTVPRHVFLDTAFLEQAYTDKAFRIGEGQTISQPYTVAFQTQLLQLKAGEKVLEIGTGSGYQASILCQLGAKLFSVERIGSLSKSAGVLLKKLGYKADLLIGDGSLGWKVHAPFHKIIVTAGAPVAPEPLLDQLENGGIMVIPIGDHKTQSMIRYKKDLSGKISIENHGNFRFVPLLGEKAWKAAGNI